MIKNLTNILAFLAIATSCKARRSAEASQTLSIDPECSARFSQQKYFAPVVQSRKLSTENRKPALIVYAIDTAEPFMQIAVNYELATLKSACRNPNYGRNLNWVFFRNSSYLKGMFDWCEAGKLHKDVALPAAFLEVARMKEKLIFKDKKQCGELNGNRICVHSVRKSGEDFPPNLADDFAKHPFAHREFFSEMLHFVSTELFKPEEFAYFLHVKSHGSEQFSMTGLTPAQIEVKGACQRKLLQELRERNPNWFSGQTALPGDMGEIENGLGEIENGLGEIENGLGELENGLGELENGLGELENGLGEAFNGMSIEGVQALGLGSDQSAGGINNISGLGIGLFGLGANNHFGTTTMDFVEQVFHFAHGTNRERVIMPFVFLEACSSKVFTPERPKFLVLGDQLFMAGYENDKLSLADVFKDSVKIAGFYSASGPIWYRNIYYDQIFREFFEQGDQSVSRLAEIFGEATGKIPNYTK